MSSEHSYYVWKVITSPDIRLLCGIENYDNINLLSVFYSLILKWNSYAAFILTQLVKISKS